MLSFTQFDWQEEKHAKAAERGVDVLFFTNESATVRKGYLHVDCEEENYCWRNKVSYKDVYGELTVYAEDVYFMEINVIDR